jgi:heme exporter protein CcmD
MSGLADWLAMGGYATFVWPCYVLAAALLIGMALQARARLAAAERALGKQGAPNSDTDLPR